MAMQSHNTSETWTVQIVSISAVFLHFCLISAAFELTNVMCNKWTNDPLTGGSQLSTNTNTNEGSIPITQVYIVLQFIYNS